MTFFKAGLQLLEHIYSDFMLEVIYVFIKI